LPEFLKKYEQYGALGVNWRLMGSDDHIQRPAGGALKNYISCFPEKEEKEKPMQRLVKSIVNTKYANGTNRNPHHFVLSDGAETVDVMGHVTDGPYNFDMHLKPIAVQHYLFKSLEDFQKKSLRGSGALNKKPIHYFNHSKEATDTCPWGTEISQRLDVFARKTFDIILDEDLT